MAEGRGGIDVVPGVEAQSPRKGRWLYHPAQSSGTVMGWKDLMCLGWGLLEK